MSRSACLVDSRSQVPKKRWFEIRCLKGLTACFRPELVGCDIASPPFDLNVCTWYVSMVVDIDLEGVNIRAFLWFRFLPGSSKNAVT